eukprot:COSAG02_NODE_4865_length_4888_cov_2.731259_6_plen_255_part_00
MLHIDVKDVPDTQLGPMFAEAAVFIHTARARQRAVYVHCTAGISRSTTIAAAYLMASLGLNRSQALGHIHRCRETACPNEGFLAQLHEFEGAAAAAVGQQLTALEIPSQAQLRERDLRTIAESLRAAEEAARVFHESILFFRDDGTPVPPELAALVCDPGDGNGSRVPADISKVDSDPVEHMADFRMVATDTTEQGGGHVNWGLEGYEEQKQRLRELLLPQLDAGAKAGGSVGLEWLAAVGVDGSNGLESSAGA